MARKSENKITVVAAFELHYDGKVEKVKRFDKAWVRVQELAKTTLPVEVKWAGWERLDG